MIEWWPAIGSAVLAYGWWLLAGGLLLVAWVFRRSDRSEIDIRVAVGLIGRELEQAPDRLYVSVHPNWSVYRKQVSHRLKLAVPNLSTDLIGQVLAEFDACYELSDGVYIRLGSAADDSTPLIENDFVPLVVPTENFRLQKLQARRRWRRTRAVAASIFIYGVVVIAGLWILILIRGHE